MLFNDLVMQARHESACANFKFCASAPVPFDYIGPIRRITTQAFTTVVKQYLCLAIAKLFYVTIDFGAVSSRYLDEQALHVNTTVPANVVQNFT
jgi:hypothetical protein